jgi:hypothetical protein
VPSQEDSSLQVSWPGVVVLLLAILGLIATHTTVESPRPAPPGTPARPRAIDNLLQARLWQDPLATARRGQWNRPLIDIVSSAPVGLNRNAPPVLFLFDCIDPDEETTEAAEQRRRERYATLSALSTAGYVPAEPDHIRCVRLVDEGNGSKESAVEALGAQSWRLDDQQWAAQMRLPYEWYRAEGQTPTGGGARPKYAAVCVVWVNALTDSNSQLKLLGWMTQKLNAALPADFAISGRIETGQLLELLDEEVGTDAGSAPGPLEGVTLYVTFSTEPLARRQPKYTKLQIEYVIGTDDYLALALLEEFRRRGMHPNHDRADIAIVAERDTRYGRRMHADFDKWLANTARVHHYSYLRGLDAKALGGGPPEPKDPAEPDAVEAAVVPRPVSDQPTAKMGEGDSQFDYLPRLAGQMRSQPEPLKAIGILGSDVYDKLVLLRALRPQFPGVVFFTTDLDVRLLQPGNYGDTRNLLIASHFGLSLRDDLQGRIAPFRSSYDTASYLGCLRAVGYLPAREQTPYAVGYLGSVLACPYARLIDVRPCVDVRPSGPGEAGAPALVQELVPAGRGRMPAHVYEVGRTGAYELTVYAPEEDPISPANPRLSPWVARAYRWLWLLGVVACGVLLLLFVSRTWTRLIQEFVAAPGVAVYARLRRARAAPPRLRGVRRRLKRTWRELLLLGAILAGAALLMSVFAAHTSNDGEPFELFEGLSIWPTVVMRLLAVGLCVYYVLAGWEHLWKQRLRVRKEFHFGGPAAAADSALAGAFRWAPGATADARGLYKYFEGQGRARRRARRCALMVLLNIGLLACLWCLFMPSVVQARGAMARAWYFGVLIAALPAMTVLLMFVVDSTVLAFRFVTSLARLDEGKRNWPAPLLQEQAKQWGLVLPAGVVASTDADAGAARRAVGQWLCVRLIDDVTHVVTQMIYCPFVVLLVLVVAQNRLFDDWHWNVPFAFIALLNAGAAVACAAELQRAAKGARAQALHALDDLIRARAGPTHDGLREQLTRVRADIAGFKTGAFSSFRRNPVVGAILLPLFGGGGLAALEAILQQLR